MKKRLTIILTLILFVIGCSSVSFKPTDITSIISDDIVPAIGYYVAKNNKKHIPEMEKWYQTFNGLDQIDLIQTKWKEGQDLLADAISDDPFIQSRIAKAMGKLELQYEGPQLPVDIERYRTVASAFMEGVYIAKTTE